MIKKNTGLKRRIMAALLAALLTTGTVNTTPITALAAPGGAEEMATEENGFEKLANYIENSGKVTEYDEEVGARFDFSDKYGALYFNDDNGEHIILMAETLPIIIDDLSTSENRLELHVGRDNECELVYSFLHNGERVTYSSKIEADIVCETSLISLDTESEVMSEDIRAIVNEEVTNILPTIMKAWNEGVKSNADLSMASLGFSKWFENEALNDISVENEMVTTDNELTETENLEESSIETTEEIVTESDENESVEETATEETATEDTTEEMTSEESVEITTVETTTDEMLDTTEEDITVDETEELNLEAAVSPVIERISINLKETDLYIGDSLTLKAYVFPENATGTVSFASADTGIATVTMSPEGYGIVKGKTEGDVDITAISAGATAVCRVHVIKAEIVEEDIEAGVEIEDGIFLTGFKNSLDYTGTKVTQTVRVYDHKKLLKEKTDYTITYANNINACDDKQLKSPSMTVLMKGQYAGKKTLYFQIKSRNIEDATITTDGIALTYNKRQQKHIPTVMLGTKKLVNKTDFNIEYFADEYLTTPASEYTFTGSPDYNTTIYYRLTATDKNFTGTTTGSYVITANSYNLSRAGVKFTGTVKYMGVPLSNEELKLAVVLPGTKDAFDPFLSMRTKVTISDAGNTPIALGDICVPGTYTIRIEATDANVAGIIEKKFKVVSGNNMARLVEVDPAMWADELPFNKAVAESVGIEQPDKQYLKAKDGVIIPGGNDILKGKDYTVTYANNKKAGVAKVTFKGIGRFTGSVTKTFKIVGNESLEASVDPTATYLTGGAVPKIVVEDANHTVLTEKKDYVVTYKNNTKVGTATYKIIGRGNYAKSEIVNGEGSFDIIPSDLKNCSIVIADKVYSPRAGAYKAIPVIYDTNGKKLVPGKDYSKDFVYYFAESGVEEVPDVNTHVNVAITGLGNFAGSSAYGHYKIIDKAYNISKLQIVVDPQNYTGRIIEPTLFDGSEGDIHVYLTANDKKNKIEQDATQYVRVVSYANNIKAGVGKITLAGTGPLDQYGGTRVVTFKINKKSYMPILVDTVTMSVDPVEATTTNLACGHTAEITVNIGPDDAENKTMIFTTSNPKFVEIVSVTPVPATNDTQYKLVVKAIGNGVAHIKATSQGSGKYASVPIRAKKIMPTAISIKEKSLVKGKTDEPYQLTVAYTPVDAYVEEVEWSSSCPSVASVSNTGLVTFNNPGIATIYVKSGKLTDYCIVRVTGALADSDIINVAEHGITPENKTDNTKKINNLINTYSGQGKTLYFPAGEYTLQYGDANTDWSCIYVGHGKSINFLLEKEAVLKAPKFSGANPDYNVVRFDRAVNCSFDGGKIIGDRDNTDSASDTEGGMGIGILKGKSISISNVEITKCWGDGIWIGDASTGYDGIRDSYDITVSNCNVHHNRRNNISLVGSKYITIIDCHFDSASGTAPQYGMDIETNNICSPCEHIRVINSYFLGNGSASVGIITSANDIEFSGCHFDGMIYNCEGRNLRFIGCTGGTLDDDTGEAIWN